MKLQVKFAIYNALSKALIILAFGAILPLIVEKIVYHHIDQRLKARSEKVLKIIKLGGINDIIREQDCSFESYNILKEEFVSIKPILTKEYTTGVLLANENWTIEGEQLRHRVIRQSFIYDNQIYQLNIGEGLSTVDQLKSTINRFSLWMMIIIIFISVFVDLGFVRLLLKPFYKIIATKLQPSLDPVNFNSTPLKSSTYEFEHLDTNINNMMHKIKDAFLVEKEFIANVSHELQTPISIVQNRLENIIVDGQVSDDVTIKLIDSQRTLGRMSKIIKALLLISRIENDQYIKDEKVNACEMLDEVIAEIEDRLQEKSISINKNYTTDFEIKPCNRTLLFTMLFNIINNAIKYNKEGGTISISTKLTDNLRFIEISDSGIGIEEKHIALVFDRFKRINQNTSEGYGLGLTIVKTIANFHQMKIEVKSAIDKGTTFTIQC